MGSVWMGYGLPTQRLTCRLSFRWLPNLTASSPSIFFVSRIKNSMTEKSWTSKSSSRSCEVFSRFWFASCAHHPGLEDLSGICWGYGRVLRLSRNKSDEAETALFSFMTWVQTVIKIKLSRDHDAVLVPLNDYSLDTHTHTSIPARDWEMNSQFLKL